MEGREKMETKETGQNEYSKVFDSQKSRASLLRRTQPELVEELSVEIREKIPDILEEDIEDVAAFYGLFRTNNVIAGYSSGFVEDVKYLMTLQEASQQSTSERIREQEDVEGDRSEIHDRKDPIKDKFIIRMIMLYNEANTLIDKRIGKLIEKLISLKAEEYNDVVIGQAVIRSFAIPLYKEMRKNYSQVTRDTDLRFLTAQIIVHMEALLRRKYNLEMKSQSKWFEQLKESYPLSAGDDLYWDLANIYIIGDYYEKIVELIKPQVEEAIEVKKIREELETQKEEDSDSTDPMPNQKEGIDNTLEDLNKKIYRVLYGKSQGGEEPEELISADVEEVLKLLAIEEFGVSDTVKKDRYAEYLLETMVPSILSEYPELVGGIVDMREYDLVVPDAEGYYKENQKKIHMILKFKLRTYGISKQSAPKILINGFSRFVIELAQDARVQDILSEESEE